MKHTAVKLVAVLTLSMMLASAAIMIAFHFIINGFVKTHAYTAIEYGISEVQDYNDAQNSLPTPYGIFTYFVEPEEEQTVASWIFIGSDHHPESFSNAARRELAEWCRVNIKPDGVITYAKVGSRQYYVAEIANNFADEGSFIIYVDTTAEHAMIRRFDVSLLVIMALCATVASAAGIKISVKIERGQERQKKFFENVSHELKTPLMAIQGYAEGIYDGVITDEKHAVSVIMSESDKMTGIVDELLCISRLESGATRLKIEPVALQETVNNCLVAVQSIVEKKKLVIEPHLSPETVQADPAHLDTAVVNLIGNAVKFAETSVVLDFDGRTFKVWNDGEQVPQEDICHIFDRFYIGKKGSSGIGLALAKEICNKHGWRIYAEQCRGGTQLVIEFMKK